MLATESEASGIEAGSLRRSFTRLREHYPWTFRGLLVLAFVGLSGFGIGLWYGVPGIINGTAKHLAVFSVYTAVVWFLVVNIDTLAYIRREYFFTWVYLVLMGAGTVEAALITHMGFAEYAGIILAEQVILVVFAVVIWSAFLYLKWRLA